MGKESDIKLPIHTAIERFYEYLGQARGRGFDHAPCRGGTY